MAYKSYNFGTTGTGSTTSYSNTNLAQFDGVSYPSGNTNLTGSAVVNIRAVSVNGLTNGSPTLSNFGAGWCIYIYYSGTPNQTFTRYTASGYTIQEDPGTPWNNSSLYGSVQWSTVPNAPSSITTTKSGASVTVSCGTSTDDGGNTISGYYVRYSENGGAYSSGVAMTSRSYTYTGLNPGSSYVFQVYSTNADGNSAGRAAAAVTIVAPVKVWDTNTSGAWGYATTAKRFNGTTWVNITTAKRWNGSAWIPLS